MAQEPTSGEVLADFDELAGRSFPEDWHVRAYFQYSDVQGNRLVLLFARYEDYTDQQPWFRFQTHARYTEHFDNTPALSSIEEGNASIIAGSVATEPAIRHAMRALTRSVLERLADIEP